MRTFRARLADIAVQLVLLATGALAYLAVQQYTSGSTAEAVAHARDVVALEQRWGLAWEQEIQSGTRAIPGASTLLTQVYVWGYFPALIAILVWVYLAHRDTGFRVLRAGLLLTAAVGFAVYASYPCAPPWISGGAAVDDTVAGAWFVPVARPPGVTNHLGALPSFHVGWVCLAGLVVAGLSTSRVVRALCVVYPVLMAWAVVATGNHWVLDIPAGAALGIGGWLVAVWLTRRTDGARDGATQGAFGPVPTSGPPAD